MKNKKEFDEKFKQVLLELADISMEHEINIQEIAEIFIGLAIEDKMGQVREAMEEYPETDDMSDMSEEDMKKIKERNNELNKFRAKAALN